MRRIKNVFVIFPFLLMSILSCVETSSCDNTMCENGGVCIDGTCDCAVGFTGIHCSERATPDYMLITEITLTRFPGLKDGSTWDQTDGPDIFYRMFDGNQAIAQPDALFENAVTSQQYNFQFAFIELRHVEAMYTLQLLDYDGIDTKEDFMGDITFIPFDRKNNFSKTILLDNGGPIAFSIQVEYYYNNQD